MRIHKLDFKLVFCYLLFMLTFVLGTVMAAEVKATESEKPLVIVVTATRQPLAAEKVGATVKVITAAELQTTGAQTVSEALGKLMTTLNVSSYGSLGSNQSFSLHGSTSDQVLVLVDGVPINTGQMAAADLNSLALSQVERVEVVNGPLSSLYGANALGGVINIITRSADPRHPRLTWETQAGSYVTAPLKNFTQKYLLSYQGSNDLFDYLTNVQFTQSDGYRPHNQYTGKHFFGKLEFPLTTVADLTTTLRAYTATLQLPDPSLGDQDDDQYQLTCVLRQEFSTASKLTSTVFYNKARQNYQDAYSNSHHENRTLGVNLQFDTRRKNWVLTGGLDTRFDTATSTNFRAGGTHAVDNVGLYGQWIVTLRPPLTVTLGLRGDHHSVYGNPISPSLSLAYKVNASTTLRGNVGRGFRAPSLNELYWDDPNWGTYGNPSLKPEDGRNLELSLEKLLPGGQVKVTLFQRKITNLIAWQQQPNFTFTSVNIGSSRNEGIDLDFSHSLGLGLTLTGQYSYLKTHDFTKNDVLPYTPAHKVNLSAKYTYGDWLVQGWAGYTASQVYWDYLGNRHVLPDFTVVDLSVVKKIVANWNLNLTVENLFDHQYERVAGYPMPGRTVRFGIKGEM